MVQCLGSALKHLTTDVIAVRITTDYTLEACRRSLNRLFVTRPRRLRHCRGIPSARTVTYQVKHGITDVFCPTCDILLRLFVQFSIA